MENKPTPGTTEYLKAEFSRLRHEGLTLSEVAEKTGYSSSYVCRLVDSGKGGRFFAKKKTDCIYPGLRSYINSNAVTTKQIAEILNYKWTKVTGQKIVRLLRGEEQFRMPQIRALMKHSGMSFEELFGGGE